MAALIAFCTCPDRDHADTLARALVDRRLAACVSLLPGVHSVYRWQGGLEHAEEVQLLIKTSADRFAALQAAVLELHPYELPELIAVEVAAGLAPYLAWIGESTRPDAAS
jgi:periplasmic divalent cation tolerance protein